MFFKKDKYYKAAMEEAAKQRELDAKKARLLSKDMDYAFLEEIIQKMKFHWLFICLIFLSYNSLVKII